MNKEWEEMLEWFKRNPEHIDKMKKVIREVEFPTSKKYREEKCLNTETITVEKRLLKLLRDEIENYDLTPHIRRVLEDEEYVAKQGHGDKPDVSVEEFDNFMNGEVNDE